MSALAAGPRLGTLSTALRLGGLFGPVVFGVTAAAVALLAGVDSADRPRALTGYGTLMAVFAAAATQVVVTGDVSARLSPPLRGAGMGLLNLTFFVGGGVGSAVAGALAQTMGLSGALVVVAVFPLVAAALAVVIRSSPEFPFPEGGKGGIRRGES
ncbi:hypothetical protein ACFYY8_25035 [Streptosporangium sp. NPDC001559]|uniref:hypothetical protein n=1 Tax=Streptosporangium sp. NPDC001559 TaxID=3366187 RepID=UPI0036E96C17